MNDIFLYEKRKTEIGKRIRTLRKEKGLTQRLLADRISDIVPTDKDRTFGQTTVSGWEKGNQLPPLPKLIALSEILQCDISYLLCDYDTKQKSVSEIADFTGLSEESIRTLHDLKEHKRGPINIFAKQDRSYGELLDYLIMSEHFIDMLNEIGYYLMDGVDIPQKINEDIPDNYFIVRNWMEGKGYAVEKKNKISEMHLQTAADILKTAFREVLKKELSDNG